MELTGVFGVGQGMVGGVKIGNKCCPRASSLLGTFPGTFFIPPHPSSSYCMSYPFTPGDIEAFKGMPLTSLDLYQCNNLTGVFGLG